MAMATDDEALLRAVLADPSADAPLLIYADWLDERGDPRGAYLRAQVAHRKTPTDEGKRELVRLYPHEHLIWAARLEQAGAVEANLTRHEFAWWGVGIGPARDTESTYERFAYHDQPPLPVEQLDGAFDWLCDSPPDEAYTYGGAWKAFCERTRAAGYFVPPEFERFMSSADLPARIKSCTDNYFQEPPDPDPDADFSTPCEVRDDGLLVSFYADSQYCILWAILLPREPGRYAPVLSGPPGSLFPETEAVEGDDDDPNYTALATSQFEQFVYRWWIENEVWFAAVALDGGRPLTPTEQAYLDHFRR